MNLDGFLLYWQLGRKKFANLESLIALQLYNLAHFGIFHYRSITRKVLLQSLEDSFLVKFSRNALDRCQGFSTVPLLNANILL